MRVGLAAEPYASMIGPSSGSPSDPGFMPTYDDAARWSGLRDEDQRALGIIAAYAGELENWLWRLLREFAGGTTPETQVLTRDLPLSRITNYLRELGGTERWVEFFERYLLSDYLADVDDAMRMRNKVFHGGVNGSAIDQAMFAYTARKRHVSKSVGMDTETMRREELPALATALFELQAIALSVWIEAASVNASDCSISPTLGA